MVNGVSKEDRCKVFMRRTQYCPSYALEVNVLFYLIRHQVSLLMVQLFRWHVDSVSLIRL